MITVIKYYYPAWGATGASFPLGFSQSLVLILTGIFIMLKTESFKFEIIAYMDCALSKAIKRSQNPLVSALKQKIN